MQAAPTIGQLNEYADEATRTSRRLEKASRENAQAHARLRDAMRAFAAAHPAVSMTEVRDA